MKVILTGPTGFIGSEVLTQCRNDKRITEIVALTRRPLDGDVEKDQKVEVLEMKDFKVYSEETLKKMEGADACIWCIGDVHSLPEVEIDYPLAFANTFGPTLKKPFRYLHCSGILAEKDQSKPLWFLQEGRRIKGTAESEMIAFAENTEIHNGLWSTFIVKPSLVLRKQNSILPWFSCCAMGFVRVDELAAAMIDIARNGSEEQVAQNPEIVMRGRSVLDTPKFGPKWCPLR